MKKPILLAVLLLLVILQVTAQEYEYVPFPTKNATWSNLEIDYNRPAPYLVMNIILKIFDQDTTIDGMVYHKVYSVKDSTSGLEEAKLYSLIGEKDKKINLYIPNIHGILTMYDFNIDVGDTIATGEYWEELIVSKIDTIFLGGKYRKRISFTWSDIFLEGMRWIEGIGSTNGLLWPGLYDYGDRYRLLCYKETDNLIYYNNWLGTCYPDYPTTMDAVQSQTVLPLLRIEPNPASDFVNIATSKPLNGALEIFTLEGKQMKSENIVIEKNIQIAVNDLCSGVYIITFRTNNHEVYYNKLLIQH
jgi:hypothetical protein